MLNIYFYSLLLETQIFVEKLFDAVNTKSYLPPPEQPSSGSLKVEFFQHQEKETKKEEVSTDVILSVLFFSSFPWRTYLVQLHHVCLLTVPSLVSEFALQLKNVWRFMPHMLSIVFVNISSSII